MAVPASFSELGVNLSRLCFSYPDYATGRLHGPQGYTHCEAYRDWLRDEFSYRCAYCLMRETWLRGRIGFQIDHSIPPGQNRGLLLDYANLVYTCPWCNQAKSAVPMPNPTEIAYGRALHVNEDGIVEARNQLGSILIDGLKLDHPDITYQRSMVLRVVRLAEEKKNVPILLRLLGCPDDLPDLKRKRPPAGNARPAGVHNSWLEKRRRGQLALVY